MLVSRAVPSTISSVTLLSTSLPLFRWVIFTAINPQKRHKVFRRTSPLNMKLMTIILTALVFVNAAYSAAIREGSEDLLRFLNDAFELNLPPDNLKPTMLTETALETEKILYPADPTAECKASEIVNVAESFNMPVTPKPNLAEITGNAEERSIESSNSDSGLTERLSAEDSRDVESSKRLQLRSKLTDSQSLQENDRNSEESGSIDKTDMDTEVMEGTNKHPNKATVMMDISSQEMDKPKENVWYRSLRPIKNHSAEMTGAPDRRELDPEIQSLALGRMDLKDQSVQPHETDKHQQHTYRSTVDFDSPEVVDTSDNQYLDGASEELDGGRGRANSQTIRLISDQSSMLSNNQTNRSVNKDKYNPSMKKANLNLGNSSQGTVDNSTEIACQNPECTETSVEHPRGENSSLDPPKVDQKFQKDTVSYQNQLRKLCPSKRVRTSNNLREQMDLDSPERANSELLDNSRERPEEHVSLAV